MRVAVLHTHGRAAIEQLSLRVYRMSDPQFEEEFLEVIAQREAAMAQAMEVRAAIAAEIAARTP
jgi:hypothetical protein